MEQPLIEERSRGTKAKKAENPGAEKNRRIIRKLFCVASLALIFMAAEVTGGLIAGSIAILSDAAHMLSDLLGFAISIVSVYISGLPATKKYSFGYHRAGVIGAMTSVIVIWILSGFLIYFAVQRIIHIEQVEVEGFVMFLVSCFGLVTNIIMVLILHGGEEGHSHDHGDGGHSHGGHSHGGYSHNHSKKNSKKDIHQSTDDHSESSHETDKEETEQVSIAVTQEVEEIEKPSREHSGRHKIYTFGSKSSQHTEKHDDKEDLNVKATMIHILGDILQSIGVIISSVLIWQWPEMFKIADPIITLVFAVIVLFTTLKIARTCLHILMEGTPKDMNHQGLEKSLREVEGVIDIHDIHIWCLNVKKNALAMHVRVKGDPELISLKMKKICKKYDVLHTTIQTEVVKEFEEKKLVDCEQDIHVEVN